MTGSNIGIWNKRLEERDRNRKWLEDSIFALDFGGMYLGDEMNTHHFDWDGAIDSDSIDGTWRVALANLSATMNAHSAPAILLFYQQLHEFRPDWVVERTICPPSLRDQELMEKCGIRPFAVESKMPVTSFDVLCMSIDLSPSAVAVPWLIKESGIPLHAEDRRDDDTFIILGGSALLNPEIFRPFCDIMFMGEGEEILPQLIALIEEGRRRGLSREEILLGAARRWDCIYVPRFYEERFDENGCFEGTFPLRDDVPKRVRFSHVRDLDRVFVTTRPVVSYCIYSIDNSYYEISRGCEGKCAFCMGGFASLPFRTRDAALIRKTVDSIIRETGSASAIPVSFNSVSHPQINRIVSDLSSEFGDRIRLISMRMDGFRDNPELCCFISMQRRGRIAFGVEGASQRLRDLVSKNLTEDQILDTMREVCRLRFSIVKFMMICNLPTESPEDLDELYELAVKIKKLFEEETPDDARMPRLLISWNSLMVAPHTPLQWAGVSHTPMPAYEDFIKKIRELGFNSAVHENTADDDITNLFLRGDGRIAGLLEYLASEGDVRHNAAYTDETYEKVVRYLDDNGLPTVEEWFREYGLDEPLPWDIVESPASKEYLKKRYREMEKAKPSPEPVCTRSCSGCGACDEEHRKVLREMPARRAEDRRIDLSHPVRKSNMVSVQHVLMEFTYDRMHSVVIPSYWDCEIRRALYQAGVEFDPDSVETCGSRRYYCHIGAGINATAISLGRRYDTEELRKLIEEHALNFRIVSLKETDRAQRVTSMTYRMKLTAGTDPAALEAELTGRMSLSEWYYGDGSVFMKRRNLRPAVTAAKVADGYLEITIGFHTEDVRNVFRYILDVPAEERLYDIPERTALTYENKGAVDLAMTRALRDAYARRLEDEGRADERTMAYIRSDQCFRDLDSLLKREYSFLIMDEKHPFGARAENRTQLMALVDHAASLTGMTPDEDPALRDLRGFLNSTETVTTDQKGGTGEDVGRTEK